MSSFESLLRNKHRLPGKPTGRGGRPASWKPIVEQLENRILPSAAPLQFIDRGVGAGGAFYGPSFSPANPNEVYVSSDEGEVFHSENLGASWDMIDNQQLIASGAGARVEFTNNPLLLYSVDGTFNRRPTRSLDGGVTWSRANTPGWTSNWNSSLNVDQLYADVNNSNRLVITAGNNLYFSSDGGATFTAAFADTTGRGMRGAGAFFDGTNIYVGTNSGLVVSTDNGATFALATLNGNALAGIPSSEAIFSFAGARQGGTTRFVAVTLSASVVQPGALVPVYGAYQGLYTMDWGQTDWVKKVNGITATQFPTLVAMARNDIATVYVAGVTTPGVNPFVDRSTDGGSTWTLNFNITNNQNIVTGYAGTAGDYDFGGSPLGLAVSPINSSEAMVTTGLTVEETTNGGTLWTQVYADPATQNPAGATTPKMLSYKNVNLDNTEAWWIDWAGPTTIMAGYADILAVRSTDGGASWGFNYSGMRTFTGTSADMNETYQIITAPNGTLYAANASLDGTLYTVQNLDDATIDSLGGQIKFSADQGATWAVLHDFGASVVWQALDPNHPNTMYASVVNSTTGGIWVTHDLGDGAASQWQRLANQPPRAQTYNHPLTIAVLTDGTLVASYSEHHNGTSSSPTYTDSSGVFVGTVNADGSVTWTDRSAPGMHYWTKDLTIDPTDPTQSTWYVAVWSANPVQGNFPSNQGGVYKTTNRGLTWTRIFTLDAESATVNPTNANEVYIATRQNGLWFSSNATSSSPTFTQVAAYHFYAPEQVFFDPYNPNEIWVAGNGNGLVSGVENAAAGSFAFTAAALGVQRNAGQAFITVTRTGNTTDATSVDYTLSGGTAVAGVDYTGTGGTVTFGAGQATATLTVPILNNGAVGSRTVNVTLTRAANDNVLASPTSLVLTILDPGLPNLYVNDVAAPEGNSGTSLATFTVSISVPSTNVVTVNYATADGTAHAGTDYRSTSGTASIPAGSTTTTFTVAIIGNTVGEGNRTYLVNLSSPANANLFKAQGIGTIVNDDPLSPATTAGGTIAGSTNYPNNNVTNVGETIVGNLGQNNQYGSSVGSSNFRSLYNALYDPTTGYGYFSTAGGTNVDPGLIIKVNLNGPTPVEVGWTQAGPQAGLGLFNFLAGVIDYSNLDPAKHYAYFGTTTSPGRIIKVRLNAGNTAPTYIGSITLNAADNEGSVFGGVIDTADPDPTKHFAYFSATNTSSGQPARIVKLALTTDDTFSAAMEVAAISLASGETNVRRAVIDTSDPNNHYAYFASNQPTNPFLVKIKLGASFQRIGSAALAATEEPIGSAVIDPANGYIYLGTYNGGQITASVVMVAEGAGDALPIRVGAIALAAGQRELSTAVIDPVAGYVYFGDDHTYPANIYKVKLAAGGILPTEVATVPLAVGTGGTSVYPPNGQNVSNADAATYGEIFLQSSLLDLARGYAYFGTDTVSGQVVKLQTSQEGVIKGTKMTLAQTSYVSDVRFYSHAASGDVRLAIYDNSANKVLLWQSGSIANTTANDFLTVPITPGPLTFAAGTYWLAWQIDTTADVPSYTPGSTGDGFVFSQSYGAFPTTLAGAQSTSEKWSLYVDFSPSLAQANLTVSSSLNPSVLGQQVTFTATVSAASPGAGTPTGTVQFVIDGSNFGAPVPLTNGSASVNDSALSVGTHTVAANYSGDGNFTSGSGTLAGGQTVTPGTPTSLTIISGTPQSTTVGTAFSSLVVQVLNQFGVGEPGVAVTFSAPGGGAGGTFGNGTSSIGQPTGSTGQAVVAFTANVVAGSYSVTASVAGLGTTASFNLTNNSGPFTNFVVSAQGGTTITAGGSFIFTVQASDQYGNPLGNTGFNGTVTFTTTDPQVPTLPSGSLSNGFGFFLGTLKMVGSRTLTAASGSLTGTSAALTVTPGAATHFSIATGAAAVTGASITVTVIALDAYGNTATGYSGTVKLTSSDAAAAFPVNNYPFTTGSGGDNGQHSFSATLNTAGSQTITATDTTSTNPVIAGTSAAIITRGLMVSSFTPTSTGFVITFDKPLNPSALSLYGVGQAAVNPPGLMLIGPGGTVKGTVLLDAAATTLTFVQSDQLLVSGAATAEELADGSYTLTLSSGQDGFQDTAGKALDGAGNGGTANYVTHFSSQFQAATVGVTVTDFAVGPGQAVNLRNVSPSGLGLPINITDGDNATQVVFNLTYNTNLLVITGATADAVDTGTPGTSTLTRTSTGTPDGNGIETDQFTFSTNSATTLGTGSLVTLGELTATVPSSARTLYKAKALLHLSAATDNGTHGTLVGVDGVQVNAYLGDTSGNGVYDPSDSALAARVAAGADTGFAAYRLADPVIVGGVSGAGFVAGADASQIAAFTVGNFASAPFIPPLPSPTLTITSMGPDPALRLPARVSARTKETAHVPVNIALLPLPSLENFFTPRLVEQVLGEPNPGHVALGWLDTLECLPWEAADVGPGWLPNPGRDLLVLKGCYQDRGMTDQAIPAAADADAGILDEFWARTRDDLE